MSEWRYSNFTDTYFNISLFSSIKLFILSKDGCQVNAFYPDGTKVTLYVDISPVECEKWIQQFITCKIPNPSIPSVPVRIRKNGEIYKNDMKRVE